MVSNLEKIKNNLRAIAKRCKTIKYSAALVVTYAMLGANAFSEEAVISSSELKAETSKLSQILKEIQEENDKKLKGVNLELTQLMEQGDQVVKSPWASWQFGVNYMYDDYSGNYKGRGDKKEKYPYEGKFTRSNDKIERSVAPYSKQYSKLEKSTDPTSATSSRRTGLPQTYGISSTTTVDEPIVDFEFQVGINPRIVNREVIKIGEPIVNVPNVSVEKIKVQRKEVTILPKINTVSLDISLNEVKANPFTNFGANNNFIGLGVRSGEDIRAKIERYAKVGDNNVLWSGFRPDVDKQSNRVLETGRYEKGYGYVNGAYHSNDRAARIMYINGIMYIPYQTTSTVDENSTNYPDMRGAKFEGEDANKTIKFYLAGDVTEPKTGGNAGTIGIHSLSNLNLANIDVYMKGQSAFISLEGWNAAKMALKNVNIDIENKDNSVFFIFAGNHNALFNPAYRVVRQRGSIIGEYNIDFKSQSNIVYSTLGVHGPFNFKSIGRYRFEGANNIVYSGIGYSPNLDNLKKNSTNPSLKDDSVIDPLPGVAMTPLINIEKAPEVYGDENKILFFAKLTPDDYGEYQKSSVWSTNTVNWKKSKIGIHQGEIRAKGIFGERLAIDPNATIQTSYGDTIGNDKYTENSAGILAQSGQREGIIPTKDLGANVNYIDANDPIHALYINDIDFNFGKYSLRNFGIISENGTQVDVAMTTNSHTEIDLKNGKIVDYNVANSDYINDNNKLISSYDDDKNKAATGTIYAYAKGIWSDGYTKYTDNTGEEVSFSQDTLNKLSNEKSTIRIGQDLEISGRYKNINGKDYYSMAYLAEGGKITAKNTTAKGYGSILAYAKDYKGSQTGAISGGEIKIEGNIEAIDEWAATDIETSKHLYKNIGAYADGANSKIEITGNAKIHGTAAFADNGGKVSINGNRNDISVGKTMGLIAQNGGKINLGGGNIKVAEGASDTSLPIYVDSNSKISFNGTTNITMDKGIFLVENNSNYSALPDINKKYSGMSNVNINLRNDTKLVKISDGENEIWNGSFNIINQIKTDIHANSLIMADLQKLEMYYLNGNLNINSDINRDNRSDIFNKIVMERELITIDAGKNIGSKNGNGLIISSNNTAINNAVTGYINNGVIDIEGGTNNTVATGVLYGNIQNKNEINIDKGIAIYGENGSKLENHSTGKINSTDMAKGIVGIGTGLTASTSFGTDLLNATNIGSTKTVEIKNEGKISLVGKNSVGIYAENNTNAPKANVTIDNKGEIKVGDNGVGIALLSSSPTTTVNHGSTAEGGIIDLTGTDSSDIITGINGVGIYAENSKINLNSNYGIETKDGGIGIYLTGTSTMPTIPTKTLNYKYSGTAGGQGTAVAYEVNNSANSTDINLVNSTNGKLIGIYANGGGTFTNNANVSGTSTANEIGIAGDNTNIINNGVITLGNAISNQSPNVGIYSKNKSIINNNKVIVGNNSIAIYGNDITSSGDVKSGDTGIGVYSIDGNINVTGSIEVGANEATAIYSTAQNKNITLGNASTMTIGSNSFGIVNKGSKNTITSDIQTVNLPSESVFIYSNDTSGTVKSTTNLTNTGSSGGNYGIYSAGTVENKGDMDFTNGIGNVGIYSINGGTATSYGTIKIGASNTENKMYSIGMAAGAKAENGIQATTGNVINLGTIEVKGKDSVGMYATQAGSSAKNDGTIILDADNTIGIYADEGATAENTGLITTGTGNYKNVTGVYLGKNSTLNNTGIINIVSTGGQGIYLKGGTVRNYGTITVGGTAEREHSFASKPTSKTIGGVTIDAPAGATEATIKTTAPNGQIKIESPYVVTAGELSPKTVSANSIGMYIDTSGIRFTNPIQNLGTLTKEADLIVGTEATLNTNSKAIVVKDQRILKPYNDSIINNPQVENWNIYSGGLTWMSTATLDRTDGTMTNLYMAKIPYTEFTKDKNTYNFLDGLEQRYDMNALDSKEKRVFNKLNSIGKNEEILFHQAVDEMMGHQYANVQQRVHETSRILDKEFKYLKNEWRTMSKDSNKIKVFGMRGEYSTDTAGIIDYKSNAYGVAYLGENETFKLGETSGWYTGLVENTFKFKDIGNSKEKQLQGKLGIFKSKAFDDNNSLNWTISGEGFVGYNKMERRYLVVDEIFGAKSNYWSYGVALRNELSKDFRMTESTNFKVYGAVKAEYGRYEKIKEKSGEVRLEVKSNDYLSIKPEIGAELGYKKALSNRYFLNTKLNVAYENELGELSEVDNKARVGYTSADWYTLRSEKEDRRGNVKTDLSVGLDNERYGVTANIGYDTKGKNRRAGLGLRVIF